MCFCSVPQRRNKPGIGRYLSRYAVGGPPSMDALFQDTARFQGELPVRTFRHGDPRALACPDDSEVRKAPRSRKRAACDLSIGRML